MNFGAQSWMRRKRFPEQRQKWQQNELIDLTNTFFTHSSPLHPTKVCFFKVQVIEEHSSDFRLQTSLPGNLFPLLRCTKVCRQKLFFQYILALLKGLLSVTHNISLRWHPGATLFRRPNHLNWFLSLWSSDSPKWTSFTPAHWRKPIFAWSQLTAHGHRWG